MSFINAIYSIGIVGGFFILAIGIAELLVFIITKKTLELLRKEMNSIKQV